MRAFFFGLGYSSQASAQLMRKSGEFVDTLGTVRTADKANALTQEGISAVVFDGTAPGRDVGAALRDCTHVVVSIAPDEAGDVVLRHHRAELDAMPSLEWLCYYSTVGVYGDFGGAWIDESAPLSPRNLRSTMPRRGACRSAFFGSPASMVGGGRVLTSLPMARRGG
jgi:hypothetical protein